MTTLTSFDNPAAGFQLTLLFQARSLFVVVVVCCSLQSTENKSRASRGNDAMARVLAPKVMLWLEF